MNQDLLSRITNSPQLPTLPVIAMKVLELTRREDVGVQEIANLIMNDPALASKILKTVNSPFYGLTKQVSTVSSALVILGLQAVKTLYLGFSLLTNLKKWSEKCGGGGRGVRLHVVLEALDLFRGGQPGIGAENVGDPAGRGVSGGPDGQCRDAGAAPGDRRGV